MNNSYNPSRILHIRNIPDEAHSSDVVQSLLKYGNVTYVSMLYKLRQALIEMETLESAVAVVQSTNSEPLYILNRQVLVNFSKSQEIVRPQYHKNDQREEKPNHILLFNIVNVLYPVTVDIIHTICTPCGEVARIVIFHRKGTHALVEFKSLEAAIEAKKKLDGEDIYSACCTLHIEFSSATHLNVRRNDEHSWDYENEHQMNNNNNFRNDNNNGNNNNNNNNTYASGPNNNNYANHQNGSLLTPPQKSSSPNGGNSNNYKGNNKQHHMQQSQRYPQQPHPHYQQQAPLPFQQFPNNNNNNGGPYSNQGPYNNKMMPMMGSPSSPVLMVYATDAAHFDPDSLFNLFCCFGNVEKIKILVNNANAAMVQMGDGVSADIARRYCNELPYFGSRLTVHSSKHQSIAGSNTATTKDFTQVNLNRFTRPSKVMRNRIYKPSKVLHFFSAPPESTEQDLLDALKKTSSPAPIGLKLFLNSSAKASSGLIEWDGIEDAVTALVLCNHFCMPGGNGINYSLKMAFSTAPSAFRDRSKQSSSPPNQQQQSPQQAQQEQASLPTQQQQKQQQQAPLQQQQQAVQQQQQQQQPLHQDYNLVEGITNISLHGGTADVTDDSSSLFSSNNSVIETAARQ